METEEEMDARYTLLGEYLCAAVVAYRLGIKPDYAHKRYITEAGIEVHPSWSHLARIVCEEHAKDVSAMFRRVKSISDKPISEQPQ